MYDMLSCPNLVGQASATCSLIAEIGRRETRNGRLAESPITWTRLWPWGGTMQQIIRWNVMKCFGIALCATLTMGSPALADESGAIRAVQMDPEKLAGVNLPDEEPFVAPADVLQGNHRPRGEILHYGDQLIMEIYEDDPATFRFDEPFLYDEFILILSGKLVLTGADGESQEYVAGDSLVIPLGFTGTWQMLGNYRELIVIERDAYEQAYGTGAEQ